MRHASAASNTLASPLIVTGEVRLALTVGALNVIEPFAELTGVAFGVGVGEGDGEAEGPLDAAGAEVAGAGLDSPTPDAPQAATASAVRTAIVTRRFIDTIVNDDAPEPSLVPLDLRPGRPDPHHPTSPGNPGVGGRHLHRVGDPRREPHRGARDDRRAGARERRAERPGLARRGDDRLERRDEAEPSRLVQPIVHRERHERAVGPQHGGEERRGVREVEHRVDARDVPGQHRPGLLGRERGLRNEEARTPRAREREPGGDGTVGRGHRDRERAVERSRDVVGMALDLRRDPEHRAARERLAQDGVRRDRPRDDRRGARPEATSDRDARALGHVVGRERLPDRLRRRACRDDEVVVLPGRHDVAVALARHRPRARRPHVEFGEQGKGDAEGVEARTEVRARGGDANAQLAHRRIASTTASTSAATSASGGASASARSGSFMPLPVSTQTACRGASPFRRASARRPATDAALAGSQNTPSHRARKPYASRIASSVTASIEPPDSSRAWIAPAHDAGLPMRMAVATVFGSATTAPLTRGAAPAAWKPRMTGRRVPSPDAAASRNPFQYAVMLPAFPTGMNSASGASPSVSQISNAAVFCPSMRFGLTLFTSTASPRPASSRVMRSASSKVPRIVTTRAPKASAWESFPSAT